MLCCCSLRGGLLYVGQQFLEFGYVYLFSVQCYHSFVLQVVERARNIEACLAEYFGEALP